MTLARHDDRSHNSRQIGTQRSTITTRKLDETSHYITSGLAAIGGTVGGGMGAGIAITVAAPAVVAAGVGYGAYKIWQWLTSEE